MKYERGGVTAQRPAPLWLCAAMVASLASGCASIKRVAINQLGDALAGSGTTFASFSPMCREKTV